MTRSLQESGPAKDMRGAKPGVEAKQAEGPVATGAGLLRAPHAAGGSDGDVRGQQALQRLIGNRAAARLAGVQTKLTVGPVGDKYEQEADKVAGQVMRRVLGAPSDAPVEQDGAEGVQRHALAETIQPLVQRAESEHGGNCGCFSCNGIQRLLSRDGLGVQRHGGAEEEEVQRHAGVHHEEEVQRSAHDSRSCGCSACTIQRSIQRANGHSPGCSCPQCGGVQRRAVAADGSFTADEELSSRVQSLRGKGTPLPTGVRGKMEDAFGADFGGVRVHTNSEAQSLNRAMGADAFTHGRDIAFAPGKYNPGSSEGQKLLAHELTHTIQQTGPVRLKRHGLEGKVQRKRPQTALVEPVATSPLAVQRHSSFEHKMLGDVSPDVLEIIASSQNIDDQDRVWQRQQHAGAADASELETRLKFKSGPNAGQDVSKQDLLHVLMQEIDRLKFFRDHGPKGKTKAQFQADIGAFDPTWQVTLVELPNAEGGDPMLLTYGELNTLADYYGSTKELREADPTNRYRMLQGVRQQSLLMFMELYDKVAGGSNFASKANPTRFGEGFDDAIGSTGRGAAFGPLKGAAYGEVRLMGSFDVLPNAITPGFMQGKRAETKSQDYSAGLARNACHFAPESWHAWAKYHQAARAKALESYNETQRANQYRDDRASLYKPDAARNAIERGRFPLANQPGWQQLVDLYTENEAKHRAKADAAANDALIENGFGDHFLQDSFAAGHLINKTEVMRWFVEWLDSDKWRNDWTQDKNWRKIQSAAYGQGGLGVEDNRYDTGNVGQINPKDAQSVENMDGDFADRFDALGMRLPPSLNPNSPTGRFLVWWQERAMRWNRTRQMTTAMAVKEGWSKFDAEAHLSALVNDHVARVEGEGINPHQLYGQDRSKLTFLLREEYLPKGAHRQQFSQQKAAKQAGQANNFDAMYERRAKATQLGDFHEFLNNTLLQAGTNILHDHYCKNGIRVVAGNGTKLGKVYGDDAMLGKDSSFGVRWSAQTANMSRDVIKELTSLGTATVAPQLTDISERFPSEVMLEEHGGQRKSLANWHRTDLKALCTNQIFAETSKSAKGIIGGIKGNDLAKQVSKDAGKSVHEGEAF